MSLPMRFLHTVVPIADADPGSRKFYPFACYMSNIAFEFNEGPFQSRFRPAGILFYFKCELT